MHALRMAQFEPSLDLLSKNANNLAKNGLETSLEICGRFTMASFLTLKLVS
jgi:hypothetical protein